MKPIAHRGLWQDRSQANSLEALGSALRSGYGLETDIRSFDGRLYISHDPIQGTPMPPSFESLLELALQTPSLPLFLNIKEDGLVPMLKGYLPQLEKLDQVVFFDMSVPQLVQFAKHFPKRMLCTRVSDVELFPNGAELCDWTWVDGFHRELSNEEIQRCLNMAPQKKVYVSPELHGRDPQQFWNQLKSFSQEGDEAFVCTDLVHRFEKEFSHD